MDGAIVFLALTASWCAPCAEFKRDFGSDPGVVVIDVDDPANREIVEVHKPASLPTIVAVDAEGHEVARKVGYHGKRKMQRWMDDVRRKK